MVELNRIPSFFLATQDKAVGARRQGNRKVEGPPGIRTGGRKGKGLLWRIVDRKRGGDGFGESIAIEQADGGRAVGRGEDAECHAAADAPETAERAVALKAFAEVAKFGGSCTQRERGVVQPRGIRRRTEFKVVEGKSRAVERKASRCNRRG